MGKNPKSIVGNERGATAYKTRNSPYFRDAVKLHDVDEFGKAKPTIHIKRNKAGETHVYSPPAPSRPVSRLLLGPPILPVSPLVSFSCAACPKRGVSLTVQYSSDGVR